MSAETAQTLREMKDAIEANGWCQRDYRDAAGRMCIMGALFDVVGTNAPNRWYSAYRAIAGAIAPVLNITSWNDAPERRPEDVIKMLGQTADRVEFTED